MAFSKEKAHERAERHAARGQHDRAAREYQTIVDHDPKDIRAWLMLADCLARAGDRSGAVARYLQVAEFYTSQKALQKALAVYRQVLTLEPEKVIGVDISEEMLRIGRQKISEAGEEGRVELRKGDSERLPFSDSQFDAALVAFGVRNFENLGRGLQEIQRVLRPGGKLVVLEFSHPQAFPVKQVYGFYSRYILPRVGGAVSGDAGAYKYLPDSVAAFPDGEDFLSQLDSAGFGELLWKPLTFGVASLYRGTAQK